jgi:outer membrane immunogenic protein
MKCLSRIVCAGLLAIAAASSAFAADLPARPAPYYKAPAYAPPFSWAGFYVGINGGYGWGTSSWTDVTAGTTTADFDTTGGLVGGTLGYNFQTGVWVWGLEGDIDASWIKGTETASCGSVGCETKNEWLATARGRIGYAADRWLPYLTGGAAFGDIKLTLPASTTQTTTNVGWTVGGGLEYAFTGQWSAKVEYLYVDLGKGKCDAGACGGASNFESPFKVNIVRGGLNYRF